MKILSSSSRALPSSKAQMRSRKIWTQLSRMIKKIPTQRPLDSSRWGSWLRQSRDLRSLQRQANWEVAVNQAIELTAAKLWQEILPSAYQMARWSKLWTKENFPVKQIGIQAMVNSNHRPCNRRALVRRSRTSPATIYFKTKAWAALVRKTPRKSNNSSQYNCRIS